MSFSLVEHRPPFCCLGLDLFPYTLTERGGPFFPSIYLHTDFYWFFESRSDPANDPLIIWLTGGPGCSSTLALLGENGPCSVNDDATGTVTNPYSWNSKANILWLDQPVGKSVRPIRGLCCYLYYRLCLSISSRWPFPLALPLSSRCVSSLSVSI